MNETDCHYLCANINQSFNLSEQEQARRNIGLYPFACQVRWYRNEHYDVSAQEASNHQLSIQLGHLPDIVRNTGKSFIAEVSVMIRENTGVSPQIGHGNHGVIAVLQKETVNDGISIISHAVDVISDLNGLQVAMMTLNFSFQIYVADTTTLNPLYTLKIETPMDLIPEHTDLHITANLSFIQAL